jgi:2-amino-4-hydroxy-6-hydroxymethyldihydropteridine diphosphokinase
MVIAYIGLGSNLKQPYEQIMTALAALQHIPNTHLIRSSSLLETAPVGFTNQPNFINAVAKLQTALSARELLIQLQLIEIKQGRVRDGQKNGPRTLDLDLLLYGRETINDEDLTIPHPRMLQRAFVVTPLLEIAPDLQMPNGKYLCEINNLL